MQNDFYLLFLAQQRLFNKSQYHDLYSVYRRDSFKAIAQKLKNKFTPNNNDKQIEQLFRLWLILTPIVERIPGIYRLNWSKSNYISYLAYTTSQLTKYYYIKETTIEIKDRYELIDCLQSINTKDKTFTNKAVDIYETYYHRDNAIGRFARVLFNKLLYAKFIQDQYASKYQFLQRYNTILQLSKTPFEGAKNLTKEITKIWDYQFSRFIIKDKQNKKREMRIKITLSTDTTNKLKENLKECRNEKELIKTCESFIEKHKYIFDASNQFLTLQVYVKKHIKINTKYNIYQRYLARSEVIKNLDKQVTTRYLPSIFNEEYKNIDQDVYINNYCNPYKEL